MDGRKARGFARRVAGHMNTTLETHLEWLAKGMDPASSPEAKAARARHLTIVEGGKQ